MTSLRAGWQTWQSYNVEALAPLTAAQWDDYQARLFRYHLASLYYYNGVFTELERYRAVHMSKSNRGLYKDTRPIYNPVGRLVDSYPANVYGGQIDMANLTTGAIPLMNVDDRQRDAIRQLWRWSNLQEKKSLYVTHGVNFGDVPIKIIDERDKQRVRMEFQHPGIYKDVKFDAVGNVIECTIEYEMFEDDKYQLPFTYTEVITKEKFHTYKNGSDFAYASNAAGEDVYEWDNEYGFVPVVWVKHKDVGTMYGMSATQKIQGKVDELTSLASRIHDQIHKTVNPIYKATNVEAPQDTTGANGAASATRITIDDSKGNIPIIYMPDGSDINALTTTLDFTAALAVMNAQIEEIERDTPELALHRARSGTMTAPGIRAGYSDAIRKYEEAQGIYDAGIVKANMMAMTIGGINGYRNFEGFTLDSYDRGDLEHQIQPRSVIDDTLSKNEKVNFLISTNAPVKMVWAELGYSEEQIEQYQDDKKLEQADALTTEIMKSQNNMIKAMDQAGQMARQNGAGEAVSGVQLQQGNEPEKVAV